MRNIHPPLCRVIAADIVGVPTQWRFGIDMLGLRIPLQANATGKQGFRFAHSEGESLGLRHVTQFLRRLTMIGLEVQRRLTEARIRGPGEAISNASATN